MRDHFEIRDTDAAGRLGELSVPRAGVTVTTPAIMPVVNPHLTAVPPAELGSTFGAEIVITNAYILKGSDDLADAVRERGVHDVLGYDGAIMTDSGSFQLARYGEIDVTTEEILAFQDAIGSDIATPVDVPTPPDADRDRTRADLETTEDRLAVADAYDRGDMLVTAPIQGSTYLDLRERAAAHADETGLDVFPVGAVVPLLEDYRFGDVVDIVMAAKRGLGTDAPVHLFGAGHPMMLALATAAGCDLFDSAAYALYARDDRYLTVRGTRHLSDLEAFPCSCPVCTAHDPMDLRDSDPDERERCLAKHNLYVTFEEVRRIREAIRGGDLLELVEERARSHPAMLDGYRALLAHTEALERHDPAVKGTFFYLSAESADRPEVHRHHARLARLDLPASVTLVSRGVDEEVLPSDDQTPRWAVVPPFGPVPPALRETYPLTAEVPDRSDDQALRAAADGIAALVAAHPDTAVRFVHDGWPPVALDRIPARVTLMDRTSTG